MVKPPNHAVFLDTAFKFVVGAGLGAGVLWKIGSMLGHNEYHDLKNLGDGANAPKQAQEAERLLRRHSTHTNIKTMGGAEHPESKALKSVA